MIKQKKNNLLIIDGTSMLTNAYYNSLTDDFTTATTEEERIQAYKTLPKSSSGRYINAIEGFFKMFLNALDVLEPTHVAVVWGTSRSTNIRKEIYSGYKADTNTMDEPLREQFNTIQQMLEPLVKQFSSNKYEAIDLAGSLAYRFKDEATVNIICRNNNYLALADYSNIYTFTSLWDNLNKMYDEDDVTLEGFFRYTSSRVFDIKKVKPSSILNVSALVGSSTTNIPGVAGVGIKTATALIQTYSTIENIYNVIDSNDEDRYEHIWKEAGSRRNPLTAAVRNKLLTNKNNAFLSRRLVEINTNILVDNSLTELSSEKITYSSVSEQLSRVNLLSENFNPSDNNRFRNMISNLDGISINNISSNENCIDTFDDERIQNEDSECYILSFNQIQDNSSISLLGIGFENCSTRYAHIDDDIYEEENDFDILDFENCDLEVNTFNGEDNSDEIIEEASTTEPAVSLVESFTVNKYRCSECGHEFMIIGSSEVKFCIHCGANQKTRTTSIENLEEVPNVQLNAMTNNISSNYTEMDIEEFDISHYFS